MFTSRFSKRLALLFRSARPPNIKGPRQVPGPFVSEVYRAGGSTSIGLPLCLRGGCATPMLAMPESKAVMEAISIDASMHDQATPMGTCMVDQLCGVVNSVADGRAELKFKNSVQDKSERLVSTLENSDLYGSKKFALGEPIPMDLSALGLIGSADFRSLKDCTAPDGDARGGGLGGRHGPLLEGCARVPVLGGTSALCSISMDEHGKDETSAGVPWGFLVAAFLGSGVVHASQCMDANLPAEVPDSGSYDEHAVFYTPMRVITRGNSSLREIFTKYFLDVTERSTGTAPTAPSAAQVIPIDYFCNIIQISSVATYEDLIACADGFGDLNHDDVGKLSDELKKTQFLNKNLWNKFLAHQIGAASAVRTHLLQVGAAAQPIAGAGPALADALSAAPDGPTIPAGSGLRSAQGTAIGPDGKAFSVTINMPESDRWKTSALDLELDRMVENRYQERAATPGEIESIMPAHLTTLQHISIPPIEAIRELQRRANMATERGSLWITGGFIHPRFCPQYLIAVDILKTRKEGAVHWGGFSNFLAALKIFGNALQCIVQPRKLLHPQNDLVDPGLIENTDYFHVMPMGVWEAYTYRIHEIANRHDAAVAIRYDSTFRAHMAHRCDVKDMSRERFFAYLQLIDEAVLGPAVSSVKFLGEDHKARNRARQKAEKEQNRTIPSNQAGFNKWEQKGRKSPGDRLHHTDPWANSRNYPGDPSQALQNWAYGNPMDSHGRPHGGFPLQDSFNSRQGPHYGAWRGNKGGKGQGKGKSGKATPF